MLKILAPTAGQRAYAVAAEAFCDTYKKITGTAPEITTCDDGVSDLVIIGSDAVNDTLAFLMLENKVKSLGIRYGTDDYCIRADKIDGRNMLILAGGRGRSTIYAVYRFFELKADCRYFFDGDRIPSCDTVELENIDISESPRFEYRGLRYFAHRGLDRFQAEHWSYEDWCAEIDWMLKKRLNFFMLRIGNDDLFQRAFPDTVKYPDNTRDPDYDGYNDRTPFWDLKYRGRLREKVFEYALSRDLMSPADCGTMTHWYTRTPQEYVDAVKPSLLDQTNSGVPDVLKVWDVRERKNLDEYMKLTEAEVRDFTKSEHLFHTIGLAERNMLEGRDNNLRLKLFTYRRIAQALRERYPDSKLFIASWDFVGWWHDDEVRSLIKELDPSNTVILDYTSDGDDPDTTFVNWGVVNKFPWVFGIFHAYEGENTLKGPYKRIKERLEIAREDEKCIGFIFWPELSHSDPLVLEYLCHNSWNPDKSDVKDVLLTMCRDRYGELADAMHDAWSEALPVLELTYWNGYSRRTKDDPDWAKYTPHSTTHRNLWHNPARTVNVLEGERMTAHCKYKCSLYENERQNAVSTLKKLLPVIDSSDPMVRRDAIDLARTVIDIYLNHIYTGALFDRDKKHIAEFNALMTLLCRLLSQSDDFSLNYTMQKINGVRPVDPSFEYTLKQNIENRYCRQQCYELLNELVSKEAEALLVRLCDKGITDMTEEQFYEYFAPLREAFYNKKLADMRCTEKYDLKEVVSQAADVIASL